jgi:Secretory lipase
LSHVYPELDGIIQEHATDKGKAMLLRVENMTTAHAVLRLVGMDMGKLVDRPLDEILDMPEVKHVFESIKLGTAVPTPPVLIVQAVHDRIVSVDDIDELTDIYKSGGASVTYHRDMFSEHMLLHPLSAPMALRWLTDRFNGKPLSEHMIRTKWPTLLNPMTYAGMARLIKIAAKVVTGRTVERSPL